MRRLAVATFCALLTGCAAPLPSSMPPATPSASQTTTGAASPSPAAPRSSARPALSLGAWTHVTLTPVASPIYGPDAGNRGLAVVPWPGGFVGVGAATTAGGVVVRSPDGVTWSSTSTTAFAGTETVWLAWTGQRFIAVGATANASGGAFPWSGTVWTSTDGLTWTSVPDPDGLLAHIEPSGLAVGSAGLVLIGNQAPGQPVVLHSSDGLAWSADDTSGAPFARVSVRSVVATASGFLIGGSVVPPGRLPNGGPPPATALLRSTDGATWQAAVPPFPQAVLNLVAAGHQVLTWGTTCGSCIGGSVLAASTDDGTTWRPVPVGDIDQMMMATTGDRVVRWTLHQEPSTPRGVALTWSDDGTAWHPVEVSPTWDPDVTVVMVVVQGDRLVVFGVQTTVAVGAQGSASQPQWIAASGTLQ